MSGVQAVARAVLLADVRRRLVRPGDAGRATERLRRHAATRSPLLAERLAGLEGAPLDQLPLLSKDDLVDRFDDLVADRALRLDDLERHVRDATPGAPYRRYRVGATSGSSGRPALLPCDRWEWGAKLANAARAQAITGASGIDGPRRVARIASPSAWHLSAQVGASLSDPRRPTLRLAATTPLDELLGAIQRFRPTVLNGYASVLGLLADAQRAGDLDVRPRRVLSGGEPLTAGIRSAITEAWGIEPHDQYVTTEAGFVAAECDAHEGMHVLDHDVVVEVVDGGGGPRPDGESGDAVLVTVLASRTVPLLRYRLDDRASIDRAPCRCGRTTPRLRVAGRARELLRLGDDGAATAVHPVVVTQVLDRQPVTAWQVRHGSASVEVLVTGARTGFDADAVRSQLAAALAEATGRDIAVSVRSVRSLEPAATGKAGRFVSRP